MFSATAHLYDRIYSSFKDYPAETERLVGLLHDVHPSASRLLDVGCGTGEHARLLTAHGYAVDGIDLDPEFVRIARAKLGSATVLEGDMREFRLDRRYDAVLCLFSSIGYMQSASDVTRALRNFARHLAPGGVVIVEPWLTPEAVDAGRISLTVSESEELSICRMAHLQVEGRLSRLHFDYLVGRRGGGVEHVHEVHEMGLFTVDDMLDCFRDAGLATSYDREGLLGRGLYVGRAEAELSDSSPHG